MPVSIKGELQLVFEKKNLQTNETENVTVIVDGSEFGLEDSTISGVRDEPAYTREDCIYKAFPNNSDGVEDLSITIPLSVTSGQFVEYDDLEVEFSESVEIDDNNQVEIKLLEKINSLDYIPNSNHEIDEDEIIYPSNRD